MALVIRAGDSANGIVTCGQVMVLLEGQEQLTGSGVQARHSYNINDIVSPSDNYDPVAICL